MEPFVAKPRGPTFKDTSGIPVGTTLRLDLPNVEVGPFDRPGDVSIEADGTLSIDVGGWHLKLDPERKELEVMAPDKVNIQPGASNVCTISTQDRRGSRG